jgi:hypothetical protein
MIQGEYIPPIDQKGMGLGQRGSLLRRHPIMMPVGLIGGAIVLFIISFSANSLFPLLALMGAPAALMCVLLALVLGICGILASIISIIEKIDRVRLRKEGA